MQVVCNALIMAPLAAYFAEGKIMTDQNNDQTGGDKLQWVQCPECDGMGTWENHDPNAETDDDWMEVCDTCHGDSEIQVDADIPTVPLTPGVQTQGLHERD